MLNYRRLCRYSETEKRLVISALEVKHFSNGTSNVKMGPQIFQWGNREREGRKTYKSMIFFFFWQAPWAESQDAWVSVLIPH